MSTSIPWVAMPGYKPETWEVVQGCTKVSEGCRNCYAERLAKGRLKHLYPDGFGQVLERRDRLNVPIHWRDPRAVFVCSRSDLFHPGVSWHHITRVFTVMVMCEPPVGGYHTWGQHRFFVLTKRPERMLEFALEHNRYEDGTVRPWPSNAIAMTSAEDQETLERRMGYLAQVPAPLRGLCLEPLLDGVDVRPWLQYLAWVVVGLESGPLARQGSLGWIHRVMRDCLKAGVPVYVKQLGTFLARFFSFKDWKGEDPSEWPEVLRVRQWPKEWVK